MNYKTKISIDSVYLNNFEEIYLKQSINDHQKFKIVVDHAKVSKG